MTTASMTLVWPDASDIKVMQKRKTAHASKIRSVAESLREMTRVADEEWSTVSPHTQAAFRKLAHMLEHPPPVRFHHRLRFAWMSVFAGLEAVEDLMEAVFEFRSTLRTIVERENRALAKLLDDPEIREGIEAGWPDAGEPIPLGEALERLGRG